MRTHRVRQGQQSGSEERLSHKNTTLTHSHVLVLPKHVCVPPVLAVLVHPPPFASTSQEIWVVGTLFGGVCSAQASRTRFRSTENKARNKCVTFRNSPRSSFTRSGSCPPAAQIFHRQAPSPLDRMALCFGVFVACIYLQTLFSLPLTPKQQQGETPNEGAKSST